MVELPDFLKMWSILFTATLASIGCPFRFLLAIPTFLSPFLVSILLATSTNIISLAFTSGGLSSYSMISSSCSSNRLVYLAMRLMCADLHSTLPVHISNIIKLVVDGLQLPLPLVPSAHSLLTQVDWLMKSLNREANQPGRTMSRTFLLTLITYYARTQ